MRFHIQLRTSQTGHKLVVLKGVLFDLYRHCSPNWTPENQLIDIEMGHDGTSHQISLSNMDITQVRLLSGLGGITTDPEILWTKSPGRDQL